MSLESTGIFSKETEQIKNRREQQERVGKHRADAYALVFLCQLGKVVLLLMNPNFEAGFVSAEVHGCSGE